MISSEVRHQLAGKLWSRHFGDFSVCELEAMAPPFFGMGTFHGNWYNWNLMVIHRHF
jgi:hypothetical protein